MRSEAGTVWNRIGRWRRNDGYASPKIRRPPVELNMTSMIDVVFLLLAFFVITFTVAREGDIRH